MICTSCGQLLNAGSNICPTCGILQDTTLSTDSNKPENSVEPSIIPPALPTYTSSSSMKPRRSKQLIAIISMALVVLIASFGGLVFVQNSQGQTHLGKAETLANNADYKSASVQLNKTSTILLGSGLKTKILALKGKVVHWVEYQKKLKLAQQYYDEGRYDEAGGLLNQIGSDFPDRPQVLVLARKINSQAAIIKSIEPDVPKASPEKPTPATTSPSASTAAPPVTNTTAKRFTSTESLKSLAKATTIDQAKAALQTFLNQYNLRLYFDQTAESDYSKTYSTFSNLTTTDLFMLKNYGSLFIDEWAKYPVSWVKASQLKDIYVVKDLKVSGTTRAALPDPFGDAIYYDTYYSGDYAREVVHHEYNHLITYNLSGQFNPPDSVWQAFNPANFTYGNGGAYCYIPGNSCLTGEHPIPGFVTGYAASEISEDKAEVYSYLMTTSGYYSLRGWIANDKALANKVNNYKQFMASRSPEIGSGYFDDINP